MGRLPWSPRGRGPRLCQAVLPAPSPRSRSTGPCSLTWEVGTVSPGWVITRNALQTLDAGAPRNWVPG